ncbi:DUF2157 domain-containing protein, partial [Chroococcidiopsis cubana CCALA 043]
VFKDALLFPFALTVLGISIIYLGVLYQRHSRVIEQFCDRCLPQELRQLLPRD